MSSPNQAELRRRIENGSRDAEDYKSLASLLYNAGHFPESVALLEAALDLALDDVKRADVLVILGWHANNVDNNVEEAKQLGKRAIALLPNPESADARLTKAFAESLVAQCARHSDDSLAAQSASEALRLFDEVTAQRPGRAARPWTISLERAALHLILGRSDLAVEECKTACDTATTKVELLSAWTELGSAYRAEGLLREAGESFRAAIDCGQDLPAGVVRVYYELASVERSLDKLPEARAKLQKARSILREVPAAPQGYLTDVIRDIAEISRDLGDYEEASKSFAALVECYGDIDPMRWASMRCLAQCQLELKEFELARSVLQSVIQSPSAPIEDREAAKDELLTVRLLSAKTSYESNDYLSCIRECEAILPLMSGKTWLAETLLLLGHSNVAMGQKQKAKQFYEETIAAPYALDRQVAMARECLARI